LDQEGKACLAASMARNIDVVAVVVFSFDDDDDSEMYES
jgi:hypothetical protein